MKKCLLCLAISFCVSAQVSGIDIIQNLQKGMISGKSKTSEELREILEKYFNDKCRVVVNSEEITLNKNHFSRYAGIVAAVFPKIKGDCKLEVLKNVLNENLTNESKKINTSVKVSEKKEVKIDFVLKDKKISEINCKDVPLNLKKKLVLKGIFNLLKNTD